MKNLSVELRNFNTVFDQKKLRKISEASMRKWAEEIRKKLEAATPVGIPPGSMRSAWEIRGEGSELRIINTKRYANTVDKGRRPAPITIGPPLLRWVWANLHPRDEKHARAKAIGISRKAMKRAIPAKNITRAVLEEELQKNRLPQIVARSLKEYLQK